MTSEMTFEDACEIVRKRGNDRAGVSYDDQVMMYVYYKVATVGPQPDKPAPWSPVRKVFWEAWKQWGETVTKEDAKQLYTAMVAAAVRANS